MEFIFKKIILYRDLQRDDYVIESMHSIDSNQMKYPSERDTKWARDGIQLKIFFLFIESFP